MHSTARKIDQVIASAGSYLGPAQVTEVFAGAVEVELRAGARARAELALAFPYVPARGDVLLVIGQGDEHWVIGVLHGTGRTALVFPGDVELRAVGGTVALSGDHGVAIDGPEVRVRAGTLKAVAETVVERFTSVFQRVTGALNVRAGQAHTLVDDTAVTTAKSAAILTEEAMSINGKEIHLG